MGCTVENPEIDRVNEPKEIYWASFEDFSETSRTYLDENVKLLWHADDRISLFRTTFNEEFEFTGETGANSGGFEEVPSDNWVTGNAVSTNYAVYPYSETNALSNSEVISLTMPAVQQYAANSFGQGANTMVAASESSTSKLLPFRNVGGYLIIKLYGENTTIKSIALSGNNNEVIAGAATSQAKYGYLPTLTMSEEGTKTITLDCGTEGVTISSDSENPTSFWMVVPPITFENGFMLTITDINDNTTTKSTSKSQAIERNAVKSMAAFQSTFEGETEDPEVPETPASPANNEIWYTSSIKVEPYTYEDNDNLASTIVSHEWDSETGKGVITFNGDVTRIGDNAFYNLNVFDLMTAGVLSAHPITSITIPNSVTSIGESAFWGCYRLTSFTIPDSVTSIEAGAFDNCYFTYDNFINNSSLNAETNGYWGALLCDTIQQDGLCITGTTAVGCVSNATSVIIPSGITTIGKYAFRGFCYEIESITIPSSVTTVEEQVFPTDFMGLYISDIDAWCRITWSENEWGSSYPLCCTEHLYLNGELVTDLEIPESVTVIKDIAFYWYGSLISVTIPANVTEIGKAAFCCCGSLKEVYCKAITPPLLADDAFGGCSNLSQIDVPDSAIEDYKVAWSQYASLIK